MNSRGHARSRKKGIDNKNAEAMHSKICLVFISRIRFMKIG